MPRSNCYNVGILFCEVLTTEYKYIFPRIAWRLKRKSCQIEKCVWHQFSVAWKRLSRLGNSLQHYCNSPAVVIVLQWVEILYGKAFFMQFHFQEIIPQKEFGGYRWKTALAFRMRDETRFHRLNLWSFRKRR